MGAKRPHQHPPGTRACYKKYPLERGAGGRGRNARGRNARGRCEQKTRVIESGLTRSRRPPMSHKVLVIAGVALATYLVVALFQQKVMAVPVIGNPLPT